MIQAIVTADIVHQYDRVGSGGAVTTCDRLIKPPLTFARVSFGSGFPTSPQGYVCKVCFCAWTK